jgi:hypothetical protein
MSRPEFGVVECSCGARAGASSYGIAGLYVVDRHWPPSGHGPCLQSGTVVGAESLAAPVIAR